MTVEIAECKCPCLCAHSSKSRRSILNVERVDRSNGEESRASLHSTKSAPRDGKSSLDFGRDIDFMWKFDGMERDS